jgi:hypothetical protein
MSEPMNDTIRLDWLEKHLLAGRSIITYQSVDGPQYKVYERYTFSEPYQPTLRKAIDARIKKGN